MVIKFYILMSHAVILLTCKSNFNKIQRVQNQRRSDATRYASYQVLVFYVAK